MKHFPTPPTPGNGQYGMWQKIEPRHLTNNGNKHLTWGWHICAISIGSVGSIALPESMS